MPSEIPSVDRIDPDRFETDVSLLRGALGLRTEATMPYHAAVAEIVSTITQFDVSPREAAVHEEQDGSVNFTESGILVLRDAISVDAHPELIADRDSEFYSIPDAYIPFDDGSETVISIDRSYIYQQIPQSE